MLNKVLDDSRYFLDIAFAWCLNVKNSFQNVHGFLPFQLSIGQNPLLCCAFNDKLPAMSNINHSEILRHLNTIDKTREAFIMNENSQEIHRALRHNVRTRNDNISVSGESVYYKRACDRRWKGLAVVLRKNGQKVLVKHSGIYFCCHPCRLAFEHNNRYQKKK